MEKEKSTIRKKGLRWLLIVTVPLLLLFAGRQLLKTDFIFDIVRDAAVNQVNRQINGSLEIGAIRGDLLSGFEIQNLALYDREKSPIAIIDTLSISYRVMSLVRSPHQIDYISVKEGKLFIREEQDSTWNILNLIEDESETEESDPVFWSAGEIKAENIHIEVQSGRLLPDEFLYVDSLQTELSAGVLEEGFFGELNKLEFNLRESRLPEPIAVYLDGTATEQRYTLESLILQSGRSFLSASAMADLEGNISGQAELSPLSENDIASFFEDIPLKQDLTLKILASGTLKHPTISVEAAADGLQQFNTSATFSFEDQPGLTHFQLAFSELDAPLFTGISESPVIQQFEFGGQGFIPFEQLENSSWESTLMLSGLSYDIYQIDRAEASIQLSGQSLGVDSEFAYLSERAQFRFSVNNLFEAAPEWDAELKSENMNVAAWLQNSDLQSNVDLNAVAYGTGFDQEHIQADVRAELNEGDFNGQKFANLLFNGRVNSKKISGSLEGRLKRSRLTSQFSISDWAGGEPGFSFSASLLEFNMTEINGLEEFPTYINGSVSGNGSGFTQENFMLSATASIDSSVVNGEEIDEFNADLRIENQFLFIENGTLQSPIASAIFSLKQHLSDFTNLENRANFKAEIKDIIPLAPLFNFEKLQASGNINGTLQRDESNILMFTGDFNLENVEADTLFRSNQVRGTVSSKITEEPVIELKVNLQELYVLEKGLQDVEIFTKSFIRESDISGSLELRFSNGNISSLFHSGQYRYSADGSSLRTEELNFETQLRKLTLTDPFELRYRNEVVQMDTMKISHSEDEAYLELWVSHLDSTHQDLGLNARNLNLGELQRTIMSSSMMDGYLSGSLDIYHSEDSLRANTTGLISSLQVEQGRMDSIRFDAQILDEWLETEVKAWNVNQQLADLSFKVPFLPGDPTTFDEQFFERSVEGSFEINESSLSYWLSFLPEGVPEETEGVISVRSDLNGIAGNPELSGELSISDALFSGIAVDYFGVGLSYLHEDGAANLRGSIIKDTKSILSFDSDLPFLVDLKKAEIKLPLDRDSVMVNVQTDDFNLALFNSYVDRNIVNNLSGAVIGEITLFGAVDNLKTDGRMRLQNGSMRVVEAGITLNEMNANVLFEPERITFEQFTVRSGPGRLRASGDIEVIDLQPGRLNLNITANQFRAANTPQFSALINMQSSLVGTIDDPKLQGNLTFLNALINLQNFGDRAVETVTLEEEAEAEETDIYNRLAMEMSIDFGRQFMIRNRQYLDMEFVMGGVLDLVKQKDEDLQLFGSLEGIRGFARPLGKNFQMDEAAISFAGPMKNPDLNVRTSYEPPQAAGVRILYIIEGSLGDPEFRFDSEPELELQDIISYTLFGKPFYELESWEQVVAGSGSSPSASDYALDVLLDRVEMLASQRLGIDVVQIDNSRSGSGNSTSIKTGWYLNQRTFFAILNEVGGARPKTLFILEYLLKENLELIITQGDDTREGVDLRWHLDY